MKKNILIGIAILLVIVVVGWIVAHQTTERHVSTIEAEVQLLEATLEEAAEKFKAGTIEEHEVRDYNERISTHLDNVDDHPWSAPVVGYSDFHLDIFADLIETLEDSKEEHNDMLVAFNAGPFGDIDIDPSEPPPFPDTPDIPPPTTITDTDDETDVFDDAIVAFNDAWLYCPGTDPDCWDTGTFFD